MVDGWGGGGGGGEGGGGGVLLQARLQAAGGQGLQVGEASRFPLYNTHWGFFVLLCSFQSPFNHPSFHHLSSDIDECSTPGMCSQVWYGMVWYGMVW